MMYIECTYNFLLLMYIPFHRGIAHSHNTVHHDRMSTGLRGILVRKERLRWRLVLHSPRLAPLPCGFPSHEKPIRDGNLL